MTPSNRTMAGSREFWSLVISAIALAILTLANRLLPAGFKTR